MLNRTVVNGFELSREQVPTHLYSRPYQIAVNDRKTVNQVIDVLKERGFNRVKQIETPLQYAFRAGVIDVFTQGKVAWRQDETPQAVRITFDGELVKSLMDHSSGIEIERLSLAPVLLGNLDSGPVEDRIEIQLHEAPELLLDAVLTMEDRRFMEHPGVDLFGIARALFSHIKPGTRRQGGSTLTQQLVKNVYLNPARTLKRKVKEAIMALLVERNFNKSQILARYVNTLFLGQSGNRAIHGFALASQYYFGRALSDIDAGQLSMLVGMIPAPSAYNPIRHPERAKKRRNLVLGTLAKNGFITPSQSQLYRAKELVVGAKEIAQHSRYPVFIDLLDEQLEATFDAGFLSSAGLDLYTTLDVEMQRGAEKAFKTALTSLEQKNSLSSGFLQGAMMIIKPKTGEIVVIIGSTDNQVSGFNRALHAKRPVGSLIKPAVYLTALQNPKRYGLTTPILDEPLSVPLDNGETWQPKNYDNKYHGRPSVYESLSRSYNVPAVNVGLDVGIEAVLTTLSRLGIATKLPAYPSLMLGAANLSVYEMAQMYQTIANQGKFQALRTLRVVANRTGELLTQHETPGDQTINQAAVYLLNAALQNVTQNGTAKALKRLMPNVSLAGKTGTTNDYRDSWFAGFGGNYLGIVWVGNDDNKPTGLTGSSGALRVWAEVMNEVDIQSVSAAIPSSVEWAQVDQDNGGVMVAGCTQNTVSRPFIAGYAPVDNVQCDLAPKLGKWINQWFGIKSNPEEKYKTSESNR
jgi:penicillin-binding protein 1B